MHYNFSEDLNIAKKTEKEISKKLTEWYDIKTIKFGDNSDGDLYCYFPKTDEKEWVEIKEDFKTKETGNAVLEFESRGKSSGIEATKAKYWIYKIHNTDGVEYWAFTRKGLNNLKNSKSHIRIVSGGDKGSNTKMYLYRFHEFIKYGRMIFQ